MKFYSCLCLLLTFASLNFNHLTMSSSFKTISEKAYKLLGKFGITSFPVKVEIIAKKLGISITKEQMGDEVSGFLLFKDSMPIIGVNSLQHPNRQRFTIAHEIGHYILGHKLNGLVIDDNVNIHHGAIFRAHDSTAINKEHELQANVFAAALLMPEEFLKNRLAQLSSIKGMNISSERGEERAISQLAKDFKVSKMAMAYRVGNLNLVESFG